MTIENEVKCFFAGLAVGATAAVLFVPKSGPQTRKYLQEKAAAGVDFLKHQSDDFATTAGRVAERGARRVRHEQENVEAALDAARETYQAAERATPGFAD